MFHFLFSSSPYNRGRKSSKIHLFGNSSADKSVYVCDLFILQIQTNLDTNYNFSAFFGKHWP